MASLLSSLLVVYFDYLCAHHTENSISLICHTSHNEYHFLIGIFNVRKWESNNQNKRVHCFGFICISATSWMSDKISERQCARQLQLLRRYVGMAQRVWSFCYFAVAVVAVIVIQAVLSPFIVVLRRRPINSDCYKWRAEKVFLFSPYQRDVRFITIR